MTIYDFGMRKFMMKYLLFSYLLALMIAGCSKEQDVEEPTETVCDLHNFTGAWTFTVDGDAATEFIGQIDKFDDEKLNIHYQPDTEWNHFLQTDVNCEDGIISDFLPAGNQGTKTIEGLITPTTFYYKDSTYINFTGTPDITVMIIEGWRM